SGSPGTEDNGCKVKAEHGRRIKPRHKFTKDEQKTLKQLFENNPYPDSQTKDKLAQHFKCQVYVIENWFQNKRSRLSPTLKGKNFAIKRPHKSQDCMRTGHQDTQIQEASGSHDSEIQSIGTRSSGAAWHQGTSGSGSPLNFTPTNFAPPPMGDWPKTWRSQCSMSSVL
uniref:Homeobox domain-containing protein n=1 Tax=Peromyscus maniculatus bairdii TaxID=230844 RepID=A0A8C8TSS3_PERMB